MARSIQVHPTAIQRWFSPWSVRSLRTVLLIGLAARVLLAWILPPGYDEAYYQFYGQNLALSYFDHPAAVGLWSWIGLHLGGSLQAIRLPCLLSYTLALTWMGGATELWFGRRAALVAIVLGSLSPLLSLVALQVRWGVADPLLPQGLDTSSELLAPEALRRALQSDPRLWQSLENANVIANLHYEQTGFLALALDPSLRSRLTTFSGDPRGFAFWQPAHGFKGKGGLIYRVKPMAVAGAPAPDPEPWPEGLGPLTPVAEVTVWRGSRPAMVLEFQSFQPLNAPWPRPYGPGASAG